MKNDGGKLISCHTCGAMVTEAIAQERRWGSLAIGREGRLIPQCTRACAEVLYTKEFVDRYFREAKNPDACTAKSPTHETLATFASPREALVYIADNWECAYVERDSDGLVLARRMVQTNPAFEAEETRRMAGGTKT